MFLTGIIWAYIRTIDDPADSPDKIGIEGAMSYLNDIGVPLDEVVCLGIAELLQSETIGEFKRDKFIEGWQSVPGISTIESMRNHAQMLRSRILQEPTLYRRIYKYTFPVSRMPPARTLPLEIAVDQWQLLFTSEKGGINMNTYTTPWLDLWLEFVKTKHNRPINKDLWEQIEVFLESAKNDETLDWHSEDGAWPGAIDDFVVFVREKRGQSGSSGGANDDDAMEVE
ncbi:Scaffold-type E3 ligase [Ascosphaera aggregata]|nr:Scaffold-type E3 ligase [Ascosphaera aggregata]